MLDVLCDDVEPEENDEEDEDEEDEVENAAIKVCGCEELAACAGICENDEAAEGKVEGRDELVSMS